MDKTEKYAKMCEKAWPDIGNVLREAEDIIEPLHYCTKHQCFIEKDEDGCPKCYGRKGNERPCDYDREGKSWWIIIPRQDQLQEMLIPEPYFSVQNLLSFFFDWVDWNDDEGEFTRYTSMEQLWLAFTMREKHSKVWVEPEEEWR